MLTGPQRHVLVRMKMGEELIRRERRLVFQEACWALRRSIASLGHTVRADVGPLLGGGYIEKAPPREGQPAYEEVYRLTERGRTSAFTPGGFR